MSPHYKPHHNGFGQGPYCADYIISSHLLNMMGQRHQTLDSMCNS